MSRLLGSVDSVLGLYPPIPSCRIPSHLTGPDQRIIGMCYHHADLRARLVNGEAIDRFERLYLVRLELANRCIKEKRRYRRFPVHLPATAHFGLLTAPCVVENAAPGGLGIITPLLPEHVGEVRVEFPGNPWLPTAQFSAEWTRPIGQQLHMGLQLLSVPEYVLPAPLRPSAPQCLLSFGISASHRMATQCESPTRAKCACSHGAVPRSTTVAMTA